MNETLKRWVNSVNLIPPAKRPVGLNHNPVIASLKTSTLAVPTKAIRRINRHALRSRFCTPQRPPR